MRIIQAIISWFLRLIGMPRPAVAIWLDVVDPITGRIITLKGFGMFTLPVDKKTSVRVVRPVDAYGNPARLDGLPAYALSIPEACELVISADGMSAEILPNGAVGNVQLKVTGDADLGAGVKTITSLADIQLVAGDAVGFEIEFGPVEPK